jgi:hypothetical protein
VLHQIGSRLLAITLLLELRTVGSCMAEILTQLAAWILPPIALPKALPTVTKGGVLEAAVIRSRASKPGASAAGLVGTPELPKVWRCATRADDGVLGVGSRGACMAAEDL